MRIKYFKLFASILLISFLTTSCEKQKITPEFQTSTNYVVENKSSEEFPSANHYINTQLGINSSSLKLGKLELPFPKGWIDKKSVLAVKDPETGFIKYSYSVKKKKGQQYFYNLVFTDYLNDNISKIVLLKYNLDDQQNELINAKEEIDWEDYRNPVDRVIIFKKSKPSDNKAGDCDPYSPSGGYETDPGGETDETRSGGGGSTFACGYVFVGYEVLDDPENGCEIVCKGMPIFRFVCVRVTATGDDCPETDESPTGVNAPDIDSPSSIDDSEIFGSIGEKDFGVKQTKLRPYSSRGIYIDQVDKMANHLYSINREMSEIFYSVAQSMLEASNAELYSLYVAAYDTYISIKNNYPVDLAKAVTGVLIESAQPIIELYLFEIGGPAVLKVAGERLAKSIAWANIANTLKLASYNLKIASSLSSFKYAQKYGIKTYNQLAYAFDKAGVKRSELGVQIHHLIEKRFAGTFNVSEGSMKSIVLTVQEHAEFTAAWLKEIPKKNSSSIINTTTATVQQIETAARKIYKDYPEILQALGL